MRFGLQTLRRWWSDRKSRDCPAVEQEAATKRQKQWGGVWGWGGGVRPFFTPTSIFTVIYGEHITHE